MITNNPSVSSITYVKNGEKYIEQCVRSVMNQTLSNIEIIVVDGGSSDGTMSILEKLQAEDERIILMTTEGSVGSQFNAALDVAVGEYIAVCEGDDYIFPKKYEKQYNIAKKYNLDVLRANYYRVFESKGQKFHYEVDTAPSREQYDILIDCEKNEYMFLNLHVNGFWNGLYSREFLLKNRIYMNETKGASYQDISFSFFSQLYAKRILFMKECLHCYRIDNPTSSVNSKNCIQMLMTEYGLLKKELESRNLWEKYQSIFLMWEMYSYDSFSAKLSRDVKDELLEKIYFNLKSQQVKFELKNEQIRLKVKQEINALYGDEKKLFLKLMKDNKKNEEALRYFYGKGIEEKRVVLFGIGHFGSIVYDYLKLNKKEIILVDNSRSAQEKGFRGQKIFAPNEYLKENDNTIIVASMNYAEEICGQLKKMKIDDSRIIVCEDEDFFLKKIFI